MVIWATGIVLGLNSILINRQLQKIKQDTEVCTGIINRKYIIATAMSTTEIVNPFKFKGNNRKMKFNQPFFNLMI